MVVRITQIEIRNFRSARNLNLVPNRFAVLVGKNDSGKSNVLRALNLFFNDETDPGEELNFDIDHNIFNHPNRRAKQISIILRIQLPPHTTIPTANILFGRRDGVPTVSFTMSITVDVTIRAHEELSRQSGSIYQTNPMSTVC